MTLNLIETLKISIYNPKHEITYNFVKNKLKKNIIYNFFYKNQRFMLTYMALFILLRATQPN